MTKIRQSLKNRNVFTLDEPYKITFNDELVIKEALEIPNYTTMQENNKGKVLNWYGSRLNLIRIFYNKSVLELSVILGRSASYINELQKNHTTPSKDVIDKLSFLFEVPNEFFTDENIIIKITEQFKLECIVKNKK